MNNFWPSLHCTALLTFPGKKLNILIINFCHEIMENWVKVSWIFRWRILKYEKCISGVIIRPSLSNIDILTPLWLRHKLSTITGIILLSRHWAAVISPSSLLYITSSLQTYHVVTSYYTTSHDRVTIVWPSRVHSIQYTVQGGRECKWYFYTDRGLARPHSHCLAMRLMR